jgi:hypothetical protein
VWVPAVEEGDRRSWRQAAGDLLELGDDTLGHAPADPHPDLGARAVPDVDHGLGCERLVAADNDRLTFISDRDLLGLDQRHPPGPVHAPLFQGAVRPDGQLAAAAAVLKQRTCRLLWPSFAVRGPSKGRLVLAVVKGELVVGLGGVIVRLDPASVARSWLSCRAFPGQHLQPLALAPEPDRQQQGWDPPGHHQCHPCSAERVQAVLWQALQVPQRQGYCQDEGGCGQQRPANGGRASPSPPGPQLRLACRASNRRVLHQVKAVAPLDRQRARREGQQRDRQQQPDDAVGNVGVAAVRDQRQGGQCPRRNEPGGPPPAEAARLAWPLRWSHTTDARTA